jgi:hypothetical protein
MSYQEMDLPQGIDCGEEGHEYDDELTIKSEDVWVYFCSVCGDVDARPPW